jgi:hypothetical protein
MILQKDKTTINNGSIKIMNCIKNSLIHKKGVIIGRHGSTEMSCILSKTPEVYKDALEIYSGVFSGSFQEWINDYKNACIKSDIFAAGWYDPLAEKEIEYIKQNSEADIIPLRSLEPYYSDIPWSSVLKGCRVTVVSSFADTMKEQLRKEIWSEDSILPEASWSFVRSYYCHRIAQGKCEWPSGIHSWKTAVDYLEKEVLEKNPQIVLIGCGGLAMPLALRLKNKGIIAIVLGGAIQILFGIKGLRWESHPEISNFFNDSWTFPSYDETPGCSEKIEQGCYW